MTDRRVGRLRLQQGGLERRRGEDLQIAPGKLGVRVFAGDDLALLGDADCALNRAGGLREDRLVAGPAAAADRAAPAVEQAELDVVTAEHLDQRDLRLVELPAGSQETAILVAVRIAEHDLLHAAAAFEQARVFREAQQLIHDGAAIAQIFDGLEQWDDIEIERAVARPQEDLLLSPAQRFRECRRHRSSLKSRNAAPSSARSGDAPRQPREGSQLRSRSRPNRRERGKTSGRAVASSVSSSRDALRLGKSGVIETRLHKAEHLADRALVHVRVLAQIERGKMKAEDIDGTAQVLQATLGQDLGAIGDERAVEDREIGQQFAAVAIGRRVADGMLRSFEAVDHARRRRQPRIDPGDGAPVGLVLPVGRSVGRSFGELRERIRNTDQPAVERQLAAQLVQLVEE